MCRSGKASIKKCKTSFYVLTYLELAIIISIIIIYYSMLHRISNAINLANVAVITTRKKKYADQMVKNMIIHVRQDVQER